MLTRRLPVGPETLNPAARTFSATAASAEPVQRPGSAPDGSPGPWFEVLSIDPAAIDLSRLIGGPVLLGHDARTRDAHIGAVAAARIEGGLLVCDCQLSPRPEVAPIVADIAAGVLSQVSIGYRVEQWRKTAPGQFRATRWTPLEVSLLPIAADGQCRIRSFSPHPIVEDTMTDHDTAPADQEPLPAAWTAADALALTRAAGQLGLPADIVGDLHDRGLTVDAARAELVGAAAERSDRIKIRSQRIEGGASYDSPQDRAARMGEALYTRIAPQHTPSEAARPYVGMSIPEIARACLEHAGQSTRGLSGLSLVTRAYATSSDYSLVFADTVGRELRRIYDQAPRGVMQCAARTTNRDFRAKAMVAFGDDIGLEKINEAGEYKHGVLVEAGESVKLATYGKIYGFSRQMQVNDDLGALARIPQLFAMSARAKEDQVVVDLLASNPTMSDGVALFHTASHANLATSAGAPAEDKLTAARLAMRLQKGLSGKPANIVPSILLVPAALETTAEKVVSQIQASATDDVNTFTNLRVVVDARLDAKSATAWYLVADPAAHDGLVVAYLEGQEGVTIETRAGWSVDGTEIKCRLDFGAAFVDWRSWFKNAGS